MRIDILSVEFRLRDYGKFTAPLLEYFEASQQALVSLEILACFGQLLSALPEDRGNDIWSEREATDRAENLMRALNGLGKLACALANQAWGNVEHLTDLHEKALKQLEPRHAAGAGQSKNTPEAHG